ncbi:MAG: hypothetical protein R3D67_16655 [Hyphomicrobiaceae bacterium]
MDPAKRQQYDSGEIDAEGHERPRQEFYRQHAETPGDHAYRSSAGFEDSPTSATSSAEVMRRRQRAEPVDWPGA